MMKVRGGGLKYMALICGLLCIWSARVMGSDRTEPLLTARFIPDSAPVGSMVELALAYRLPEGAKLPPKPVIKGLEGLRIEGIQTNRGEIRVRLLVDRLGEFKTGPLTLAFLTRDGEPAFLHADPVGLTILSNLGARPEKAQIKPIFGIISTSSSLMTSVRWGLMALGACAAGVCLFLWLRRRRTRRGLPRVQVLPHVAAEREIQELAALRFKEIQWAYDELRNQDR